MLKDCFEETPLEDIVVCANEEVQAGLSPKVYFMPTQFIKSMKVPAFDTHSTYKTMGTISDPIEPILGKGFVEIDLQVDLNSVTTSLVGNRGNKKDQTTLNVFVPGTRAELLGFKRLYKNVPGIFIVKDYNGRTFTVGTKNAGAYIDNLEITTGQGNEDNNGGTGTIISNSNLFEYTGPIPLMPGGDVEPTSVVVYPEGITLDAGTTQQFEAVVFPLSAAQDVVWSIESGTDATISPTGLLTLEVGAGGAIEVRATAGSVFADVTVTVNGV